jgi:hypothetical protein
MAVTLSWTETSTCCPRPLCRRSKSAPRTGTAALRPAWKLAWSPYALSGGSSGWAGSPFSVASPPAHQLTRSVARYAAWGPVGPNGEIDAITSFGFTAARGS